jgi:hypothetical protein
MEDLFGHVSDPRAECAICHLDDHTEGVVDEY